MTKMSAEQIDKALATGIIDEEQAKAMLAELGRGQEKPSLKTGSKNRRQNDEIALIGNEDDMRFVRSFSDVFIAIGIGLLCLGLIGLSALGGTFIALLAVALMWILAEYFGKKKRAHLPTLVTALGFLFFVHRASGQFVPDLNLPAGVMPALVTLLAMLVFYARFRLPFSIALIAISLLILAFSFLGGHMPIGLLLLLSGVLFFVAAMFYDMRDPARKTRFADNAFWLHFTAAPLILHGIMAYTLTVRNKTALAGFIKFPTLDSADAVIMLLIIAGLALVGLAINRRALLVSSLGYGVFAIAMLIKQTGLGFGSAAALAFLLLGGFIIFLGAGWHAARKPLLKFLPKSGLFAKIFPPAITS